MYNFTNFLFQTALLSGMLQPKSLLLSTIDAMKAAKLAVATPDVEEEILTDSDTELEKNWKVIIHNDDVTPMNFVVSILLEIFDRSLVFAEMIMIEAHNNGQAIVCALPKEEAERKVRMAHFLARGNGYPLTFTIEEDD